MRCAVGVMIGWKRGRGPKEVQVALERREKSVKAWQNTCVNKKKAGEAGKSRSRSLNTCSQRFKAVDHTQEMWRTESREDWAGRDEDRRKKIEVRVKGNAYKMEVRPVMMYAGTTNILMSRWGHLLYLLRYSHPKQCLLLDIVQTHALMLYTSKRTIVLVL